LFLRDRYVETTFRTLSSKAAQIQSKQIATTNQNKYASTNQNWVPGGVVAPRIWISHSVRCFIFDVRFSRKFDLSQPWHIRSRYVDLPTFNKLYDRGSTTSVETPRATKLTSRCLQDISLGKLFTHMFLS